MTICWGDGRCAGIRRGRGKGIGGDEIFGEGKAYGVIFHVQGEIDKAAYQVGGARLLQGPDGMDDEATRIALTHLIVQGIYYLQILGSKLALLREGDISGAAKFDCNFGPSHVRHYITIPY